MQKSYSQEMAFDRCAEFLVKMIEKYGNKVEIKSKDAGMKPSGIQSEAAEKD